MVRHVTHVLGVRDVHARRGDRAVLRGISFALEPGTVCALMGESGAGKSSMLRAIAALDGFDAGEIDVAGFTLRPGGVPPQSQLRELRGRVGMVFQNHALFEHLNATDNITLALIHTLGWAATRANRRAMDLLEQLGAAHRAHALPRQLSGGEAQRVAIARALALDPPLLLMDEPTASLDPARRESLATVLRHLASEAGRTLLIATHDVEFARTAADRTITLADGVTATR